MTTVKIPEPYKVSCLQCFSFSLKYDINKDIFICEECGIQIKVKHLDDLLKRFKLWTQDGGCGSFYLEQLCTCFACEIDKDSIHFKDFAYGSVVCDNCNIDISMSRIFDVVALKYKTVLIQSHYSGVTT